jgi:hypothetical protein
MDRCAAVATAGALPYPRGPQRESATMHSQAGPEWLHYLVPAVIFVLIFGARARNLSKVRPLKIERLWIVPAIFLVVSAAMLVEYPPSPLGWGACLLGLGLGAALGWQRGRMMQISVDPETHSLSQKGSVAAILFLLAIVAVRAAARAEAQAFHLDVGLVTDVLIVFALGLFGVQRLEMYLRATRLLQEAGGRPASRIG